MKPYKRRTGMIPCCLITIYHAAEKSLRAASYLLRGIVLPNRPICKMQLPLPPYSHTG